MCLLCDYLLVAEVLLDDTLCILGESGFSLFSEACPVCYISWRQWPFDQPIYKCSFDKILLNARLFC